MSLEHITLQECWSIFVKQAIPEASDEQRDAMYMAFLAGADTVMHVARATSQKNAPRAVKLLQQFDEQLQFELQKLMWEKTH